MKIKLVKIENGIAALNYIKNSISLSVASRVKIIATIQSLQNHITALAEAAEEIKKKYASGEISPDDANEEYSKILQQEVDAEIKKLPLSVFENKEVAPMEIRQKESTIKIDPFEFLADFVEFEDS